jgi:hypothetical protein
MQLYKKSAADDEDSISLVTTLLVRYPELCTINYSPKGPLLKLSFILKSELNKKIIQKIQEDLMGCISTYMYFENKEEPHYFKVNYSHASGLTQLEITRDTATLTQREIALIVSFLNQEFNNLLVSEAAVISEDDLTDQDDFICYMLDNLRQKNPKNRLIAVREEGRVLVFKR